MLGENLLAYDEAKAKALGALVVDVIADGDG